MKSSLGMHMKPNLIKGSVIQSLIKRSREEFEIQPADSHGPSAALYGQGRRAGVAGGSRGSAGSLRARGLLAELAGAQVTSSGYRSAAEGDLGRDPGPYGAGGGRRRARAALRWPEPQPVCGQAQAVSPVPAAAAAVREQDHGARTVVLGGRSRVGATESGGGGGDYFFVTDNFCGFSNKASSLRLPIKQKREYNRNFL